MSAPESADIFIIKILNLKQLRISYRNTAESN